eukprot:3972908-Pyramimonas_sp.AAC.1
MLRGRSWRCLLPLGHVRSASRHGLHPGLRSRHGLHLTGCRSDQLGDGAILLLLLGGDPLQQPRRF